MQDFKNPTPTSLLTPLVELINDYLLAGSGTEISGKRMGDVKDIFHQKSGRVKRGLWDMRVLANDHYRHGVQAVQQGIMDLIDTVVASAGAGTILEGQKMLSVSRRPVATLLFEALAGLLHYVEHHYPEQFDRGVPLSEGLCAVWRAKIWEQLEVIVPWFNDEGLPHDLSNLVLEPFHEIVQPEELLLITYREWRYQAAVLEALVELARARPANAEEALLRVLIRHNFNKDQCLDYCVLYIGTELDRDDSTDAERLTRTQYFRQLITSASPTRNIALLTENEALHTRLIKWIDGICVPCQNRIDEPEDTGHRAGPAPRRGTAGRQRVETPASLAELSGFHRLLYECGFFRETVFATICRHIALGFSTRGALEPVVGNVRKAFDDPSELALRFAEDLCKKMLQMITDIRSGKKSLKNSKKRS